MSLYAGELVQPGRNDNDVCERDFQKWFSSQKLLEDPEDPNGWTQVNTFTAKRTSLTGDEYLRTSTIYRANTTDPANDYFLFVQENSADAAANSVVVSNSVQLSATYGNGSALREASPFDWAPPLGISSASSFTVGSQVPVQAGSAAFTVAWDGIAGLASNVSTVPLAAGILQFQQQIASSGATTLKIPSLTYNAGIVFTVPKGTASLLGISMLTSYFQDGSGTPAQYPPTGQFNLQGPAPVLTPSAANLFVTPGSTNNTFQVNASSYLNWTLTAPDWVQTVGPVTGGQGSQSISFSVPSGTGIGTTGVISLDSSPSFASPSVASGPLQVTVHVGPAPPATGVLFSGGKDWGGNTLATAEIWDTATKTVIPANGLMGTARYLHTATALPNGKILIAGGFGSDGNALNTTEIFDPSSDTFAPGPNMVFPHAQHTATLLQDGTVLIAAGSATSGTFEATANAEIYDPAANTTTQVGSLERLRQNGTATLLNSGEVLIAGGWLSTSANVETYELSTQSFSPGPDLEFLGVGQSAVHLSNDQVLILGAQYITQPNYPGALYTPASGSFSITTGLGANTGVNPAMVLLPDQTAVIFAGGKSQIGAAIPAGLTVGYDPSTQDFTTLPSGSEERSLPTATLVPDISAVVVAGGVVTNSGSTHGTAVELFDATQKTWSSGGAMSTARTGMTSTYFTNTSSVSGLSKLR